jgi:hypothetical protein
MNAPNGGSPSSIILVITNEIGLAGNRRHDLATERTGDKKRRWLRSDVFGSAVYGKGAV